MTCGYIERFNPAVVHVKEYLKSKKFGDLIRLEFYREHRMPLHIKDVGIIYDTSVHDIDTAMWLFDETPQVVFAKSGQINHEHEDFATIMLGFKDNKIATISSNWITPTRVRNFNAVCTDGRIFSDFITQEIRIETDKGTETILGLGHESKNVRAYVTLVLANRNEKNGIKEIRKLTNDPSGLVRTCAYGALGHLEVKESAKELHQGIFDSNLEAVKSAAYALARIGEKISDKEIEVLHKLDESEFRKILKFFN